MDPGLRRGDGWGGGLSAFVSRSTNRYLSDGHCPEGADREWPGLSVPKETEAETADRESGKGDDGPSPQRLIEGGGEAGQPTESRPSG